MLARTSHRAQNHSCVAISLCAHGEETRARSHFKQQFESFSSCFLQCRRTKMRICILTGMLNVKEYCVDRCYSRKVVELCLPVFAGAHLNATNLRDRVLADSALLLRRVTKDSTKRAPFILLLLSCGTPTTNLRSMDRHKSSTASVPHQACRMHTRNSYRTPTACSSCS